MSFIDMRNMPTRFNGSSEKESNMEKLTFMASRVADSEKSMWNVALDETPD